MRLAPPGRGLPCHRVVGGQGRLVPGWPEQRLPLEQEGIAFRENGCADLNARRWKPGEAGPVSYTHLFTAVCSRDEMPRVVFDMLDIR